MSFLHFIRASWRAPLTAWLVWLGAATWPAAAQSLYFTNDASGELVSAYNSTAPALAIVRQPVSALAAVGDNQAFSVLAKGAGPLWYQWQFNSNVISGATADTIFLTNLSAGNFGAYRVVVSNALGSVTSSNALLQLDSDHDGMADSWEIAEFGNITNRDGFQDYDGDGVSDRDEFVEGTDPKNFSSSYPRLTIYSDRGEVLVTPNVALFTNGQTITLTGTPDPGQQFLGYLGTPLAGGPYYSMRTNPASLKLNSIGITGSQVIRAIFGLPLPFALNVTNGWRIDQAGWFGETNVTHDGVAAAQSARILGAPEALLELSNVVLASEGTITFWWKVDGTDQDVLQFRRNNLLRTGAIGTNTDWQFRTYYLPAGNNLIRWEYVKRSDQVSEYNGLYYAPTDAGWVDQVSYSVWPNPSLDTDGDGLPDIWEYKYFDSLAGGPNDDPDRDGNSNLTEYQDGTDPTSNASMLPRLTLIASGGTIVANPSLPKYTLSQTVQLQAVPDPTNYFVIWSGAVTGTNTTNSILMNGNKSVTATFGLPLGYVLDAPSFTWTRDGDIGFFGQTNFSYDGLHSAQAGPIGYHQTSAMYTSVTGPGTLVFWWKCSCDTNYNFGRFLIDGVEQPGTITGETPWAPESFLLTAGTHTLRWTYTNMLTTVSVTNGIWVDRVAFTSSTLAPTIVSQPTGVLAPEGATVTFQVEVTGTPPFSYQWFLNGASLGATATNAVLTLVNVSPAQAGVYSVNVTNPLQTVTSSNASLTLVPVPPVNDNFTNRTTLAGTNAVMGYTFGATQEIGEPDHDQMIGGHSVWWSWTAPASGTFNLTAIGTNLNASLVAAVYTGNAVNALTAVRSGAGTAFAVNGANLSVLSFNFNAAGGTTYAIATDHGGTFEGFLSLAIAPVTHPALSHLAFNAAGSFGFQFAAPPGASYEIDASSNLQIWVAVATGTVPPGGSINFSEIINSSAPTRFYRVILP